MNVLPELWINPDQWRSKMINEQCKNKCVVIGPEAEIARLKTTCVRVIDGHPTFDFNAVVPMPKFIRDTICKGDTLGAMSDALLILGRPYPPSRYHITWPLRRRMKELGVLDYGALKSKIASEIGPAAIEQAGRWIKAYEKTGCANWSVWSENHWGTSGNAAYFSTLTDKPGRYAFEFCTDRCPPDKVFEAVAEQYPALDIVIEAYPVNPEYGTSTWRGTIKDGEFLMRNVASMNCDMATRIRLDMDDAQMRKLAEEFAIESDWFTPEEWLVDINDYIQRMLKDHTPESWLASIQDWA